MTHSSSRAAFVVVRWLAVVAILFAFLSPFGTTALEDASPVPPEETVVVDPTAESTEPVEVTETPTEVTEATETPTATETPPEESEFSAAVVTSNGFSSPSYSVAIGGTVSVQYSITMSNPTLPESITFFAPPLTTLGTVSSSSSDVLATCGLLGVPAGNTFTLTYASGVQASSTCTVTFEVVIPAVLPAGTYPMTVIGSLTDSATIQVTDPNAPTLSLSVSPSTASVGEEVTVTATQFDPSLLLTSGIISVPIPANTVEVPGSATVSCIPGCGLPPIASIIAGTAGASYMTLPGGTTVTLTFKVTVLPAAVPGVPIVFNATGLANINVPTSATTSLSVSAAAGIPLDISFSDTTPATGDTVLVTATVSEPATASPVLSALTINLPAGTTYVFGSATVSCPDCGGSSITPLISGINVSYVTLGSAVSVQLTFSVTIGSVPSGTVLSFDGTGTGADGSPIGPTTSSVTVTGSSTIPSFTIGISDTTPAPGGTISVTVTLFDPANPSPSAGSILAFVPGASSVMTTPVITVSPLPLVTPTASIGMGFVEGHYTPDVNVATTVTITFDVQVSPSALIGQQLNFGGNAFVSAGSAISAETVVATVTAAPISLPLTVNVNPLSAEPGQTVTITASVFEPMAPGSLEGSIVLTIPDGVTLIPNSGTIACPACTFDVTESATQVSATYSLSMFLFNPVNLSYQATVDGDATVGSTLTFSASGTDSFGVPMTGATGTLSIVAAGSTPTLTIALSETSAAPGETVEVTVTLFDPQIGSGTINSGAGSFSSVVPGSATISCSPSCAATPTVFEQFAFIVTGAYTTVVPTTITITFEVIISLGAPGGYVTTFSAAGLSANGTNLTASPASLTITAAPVDLTFLAQPSTGYPNDAIVISVGMQEGQAGSGTITADLPAGVTLLPATIVPNCSFCVPSFTSDADSVTMNYTNSFPFPTFVGFSFLITIDSATPGGTVLSFTGSGTTSTGGPTNPIPASVTVLAPLTAPTLNLVATEGATITGDLNDPVDGGVPPYSFVEAGSSNPFGDVTINANGTFSYTAPTGIFGDDMFRYIATDSTSGTPLTVEGVVIVNITAAPTATPTETAVPTATATETAVPTATATETAVPTATATETAVPTATATVEPTATPTETPVPTATTTVEPTATPTETPVPTATSTVEPTATPTETAVPTATTTVEPTATPTETAVPTATTTVEPTATTTATAEPTATTPLTVNSLVLNVISGQVVTGDLNDNVSGGIPPYTFSVNQAPGIGTLDLNPDGTFTYTAPVGVGGTTSFAYNVTDSEVIGGGEVSGAASATGEVQVIIAAATLTTEPLLVNVNAGASVDGTVAGQVSGGVPPYTFTLVSNPTQGTVTTFNSDGSFTYTANADAEGADQFIYTVTDSEIVITGDVSGAATATGVVDIIIAAPTPTPTETSVPTATSTLEPGITPTATATTDTGATPTTDPVDPTKEPTSVTELPSTGQRDSGSGTSTSMLVALLTAGVLLLAVAAGRLRRR